MAKMTDLNEHIQEMIKAGATLVVEDLEEHCGYTRLSNVVLRNPDVSELDKIVYGLIRSFAYGDKLNAFPGQDRLAQYLGKRRETVNTSLNRLKKHGLIDWIRRGMGETNVYIIKKIPQQMVVNYIGREAEFENQRNDKRTLASIMKDRSLSKESNNTKSTDVSLDAHQLTIPVESTDVCLDTHLDVSLDTHPSRAPVKSSDVRSDTHQDVSPGAHLDVSLDAHKENKIKEYKIKNKRITTTTTEKTETKNSGGENEQGQENVVVVNEFEPDWHLIKSRLQVGDAASLQQEALALGINRPDFIFHKKARLSVDEQATYLAEQWTYKIIKKTVDQIDQTMVRQEIEMNREEEYPFKGLNDFSFDQSLFISAPNNKQVPRSDPEWEPQWVQLYDRLSNEWTESSINAVIKAVIDPYKTSIKDTGNLVILSKTARDEYSPRQLIGVLRELVRQFKNGLIIEKNLATWIAKLLKIPIISDKGEEANNKKRTLMRSMFS